MSKRILAAVAAVLLLSSATALAGARYSQGVYVNLASRYAWGALGGARNSADANQYIGCQTSGWVNSSTSMLCWALDTAGNYGLCSSSDARLVQAVTMMSDDSYVAFWWDANGNCTYVNVRNVSYYEPKR